MRGLDLCTTAAAALIAMGALSSARALSGSHDPYAWPLDPMVPFGTIKPRGSQGEPQAHSNPGVTAPLVEPRKPSPEAVRPPPASQADQLTELFGRLAKASDASEAGSIALLIQHLWLRSGSDTADLLMVRAVSAFGKGNSDLAAKLLDRIIDLDPTWAEAWNKRATLRFLSGDDDGAMEDIAHVLSLEPRHFGALSGMSFILQRHGMKKEALSLLRKTGGIYPHNAELEKLTQDLGIEVEGRAL